MSFGSRLGDRDRKQTSGEDIVTDEHEENLECLRAQYANQQEALQHLQEQYATLSEQYERLHTKSRDIIATLQDERDIKMVEYENLKSQILRSELDMKRRCMDLRTRKDAEASPSELETLRWEYNKLVCSYTHLKNEYKSILVGQQTKLEEQKKEHEMEVSLLMEKLKLAEDDNDALSALHQIRRLQKLNAELEHRLHHNTEEVGRMQAKHRTEISQKEQVILKQSESLAAAQSQIKLLEVECSALSENLVSAKTELKQCLQKQLALQDETEQAHRESGHIKMKLEEEGSKHKANLSSLEMKLTQEYHNLKEKQVSLQNEKREYEAQIELLQRTVKQYEEMILKKDLEMQTQMKSLQQDEWEKRIALEKENTALTEKIAAMERLNRMAEEKSKAQLTSLQEQLHEFSIKCMAMEAEASALKSEQERQRELHQKTEEELQMVKEKDYKKKHNALQLEYQKLLETKQELENECTKLQSVVCKLELAVADASNDAIHVTKVHQERHTSERQTWEVEKAALLKRLKEEEIKVTGLVSDIEEERIHTKKVWKHYKKKTLRLKDTVALANAKQVQVEEEKESLRKSLNLDKMKLKNELSKLKQREDEFSILLQSGYGCSGEVIQECSVLQQNNEEIHQPATTVTSQHES